MGFIEQLRLEGKIPAQEENTVYSAEGVEAHDFASRWLISGKEPTWPVDPLGETKYRDMKIHVTAYVKFVWERKENLSDEQRIETKVPLFYRPDDKGTVDAYTINRVAKKIYIDDLKYGAGEGVYAKENKQLSIYAESLIVSLKGLVTDDWLVVLTIFQPRDRNDDNPIRLWAVSRKELREFCEPLVGAVRVILESPLLTEFHPEHSTVCRWCPAKGICPSFMNYGLSPLPEESKRITTDFPMIPLPKLLTREQRVRVIAGRHALEQWLEAVEDFEVAQLMHGAEPLGYKLVAGKSNRYWIAQDKVALFLTEYLERDQIFKNPAIEILSVAEAEKLIGKKEFAALGLFIAKPEGKPTLVPIDDKRPALNFGPSRDFEDLDAKPGSEFI